MAQFQRESARIQAGGCQVPRDGLVFCGMQEVETGAPPSTVGLRKLVVYREAVIAEAGSRPSVPARQASVAAVIRNPWVGTAPTADLAPQTRRIAPVLARLVT